MDNYYEFLGIDWRNRRNFTTPQILAGIERLVQQRFKKNDTESANGRQICNSCRLAFQNEEARKKYDEYLEWKEKERILNLIREVADLKDNKLTAQQSGLFIFQLEEVVNNRIQAKELFENFCNIENIFYEEELNNQTNGFYGWQNNTTQIPYIETKNFNWQEHYDTSYTEPEKKKHGVFIFILVFLVIIGVVAFCIWDRGYENIMGEFDSGLENDTDTEETQAEYYEEEYEEPEEYYEEEYEEPEEEYYEEEYEEPEEYYEEEYKEPEEEYYEEEYEEQEEEYYEEDDEYILPDSDCRYIKKSELKGLSEWELRVARNELYARHGRMFYDQELQEYFDSCSWYHGRIAPDDFKESKLNKYEIKNRDKILRYEKKKGYY